ncbi:MAG: class I SAM-dependent methyltransferase [Acidimicrobiaceae bacterium]|nr:class I SAM-dependent methyltransferase [Acidimicrobiaceae bacterium]MBO0746879.1 class I SAM-dependent methyltransferase [Acidimicrobiaceae bacterium]
MGKAAERYRQMVQESEASRRGAPSSRDRWVCGASRFREDPFRMHTTLAALLEYLEPTDTVLDVGGGAGRYLPLAARCTELINVEPSPSMGAQFEATVRESGIPNARWVQSDWQSCELEGDVVFSANVLYYVADIVPFVEKLVAAARRRVMIVVHSTPPVNIGAPLYRIIHGSDQPLDPSYRELLPVLWEMGILPEVRVLGPSDFIAERTRYADRNEAIESTLGASLDSEERERARAAVSAQFEEVFVAAGDGGYRRRPNGTSRVLCITWRTDEARGNQEAELATIRH